MCMMHAGGDCRSSATAVRRARVSATTSAGLRGRSWCVTWVALQRRQGKIGHGCWYAGCRCTLFSAAPARHARCFRRGSAHGHRRVRVPRSRASLRLRGGLRSLDGARRRSLDKLEMKCATWRVGDRCWECRECREGGRVSGRDVGGRCCGCVAHEQRGYAGRGERGPHAEAKSYEEERSAEHERTSRLADGAPPLAPVARVVPFAWRGAARDAIH
ncbi:MAG: hypothetical protein QOI41_941 [Myxococcales bacterium]|nr:hypothetical protein [Myxococcales bacterium]